MSLQAAIEAILPELRAQAEARMTSRADVYRATGNLVPNPSTGEESPEYETPLTDVPVRITGSNRSRETGPDGAESDEGTREAHFPVGTQVRDGDYISLTAGENAGDVWKLVDVARTDQATALRVVVEAADPSVLEA